MEPPPFTATAFAEIDSPALLVWPERVRRNIARMLALVDGDTERLRPHVKTHKMPEVVRLQLDAGIRKFKCATIAEAEMVAAAGGCDVLLAYQPVGPNIHRLAQLARKFPQTTFAAVVDDLGILRAISQVFAREVKPLRLFLDIDCGMGRTGISPSSAHIFEEPFREGVPGVVFAGLHVYDGHLHDPDLEVRTRGFEGAMQDLEGLIDQFSPQTIIGGGSPTFGLHAGLRRGNWECSPGTTVLWDAGYGGKFPDLEYELAAALLTRVISKPGVDRLCLDLGHKAVSAENEMENRVRFGGLPGDFKFIGQSEEHLVVETSAAGDLSVGDVLLGVPVHICPTVALHMEAVLVSEDGEPTGGRWKVAARDRRISV